MKLSKSDILALINETLDDMKRTAPSSKKQKTTNRHSVEDELSRISSYDYKNRMVKSLGLNENKSKVLARLIDESISELIQEVGAKKKLK